MEALKAELLSEEKSKIVAKLYRVHHDMPFTFAKFGDGQYYMPFLLFSVLEQSLRSVEVRPDDVWMAGFTRSGTHWMAEMTWLINNNLDFEKALSVHHEERVFYFDLSPKALLLDDPNPAKFEVKENGHVEFFDSLPSPRFLKTHLPLSLLPPKLLDTTKMVYIARDPRDVIVSCYHFYKSHSLTKYAGDLKQFFRLFIDGLCLYCPIFGSMKEYWAQRNHPKLLFLFYEELHKDLPGVVRRVAKFYDRKYSDQQLERLCSHLQFSSMKKNKAVNEYPDLEKDADQLVRKGVAGGWRTEFDEEMIREADKWMEDNLRDTDLTFPQL